MRKEIEAVVKKDTTVKLERLFIVLPKKDARLKIKSSEIIYSSKYNHFKYF